MQNRFESTGILKQHAARALAVVGLAAASRSTYDAIIRMAHIVSFELTSHYYSCSSSRLLTVRATQISGEVRQAL